MLAAMIRSALFAFALLAPAPALAEERTVMVTGFDAVRVEGPFAVEVTTGGSAKATIRGDRRAIDSVDVRVAYRTLVVRVNPSAWGGWPGETADRPAIVLATPRVESAVLTGSGRIGIDRMEGQEVTLSLTGSGAIAVGEVEADELRATLIGTGTMAVAGDVARARFTSNGAGSVDAGDLRVDDLAVDAESSGDSMFFAHRTARVTATGLGVVRVAGNGACIVDGPGTVRCGTD